jgi:hypothetical protein
LYKYKYQQRDLKYKASPVPVHALRHGGNGGRALHILTSRIDTDEWLASAESIHWTRKQLQEIKLKFHIQKKRNIYPENTISIKVWIIYCAAYVDDGK